MNIRVDLDAPIYDGKEVVFRSPADCSQVTGLILYYGDTSQEFMFADAHGNNVGDIDHLFAENVVVKVIIDLKNNMAFVQNADTNAYLEQRIDGVDLKLPHEFAEEQKAQARENIGASGQIVNTAEGKAFTITDCATAPVKELKAYIPAGEQAVTSLKVISCGRNIAGTDFYLGRLFNGFVELRGDIQLPYESEYESYGLAVAMPCRAGTTYRISANMTDLPMGFITASVYRTMVEANSYKNALHGDGAKLSKGLVFTAQYDGVLAVEYHGEWSGGITNALNIPQGFLPFITANGATLPFEEYAGATYTVALPAGANGGYVDFGAKKLVMPDGSELSMPELPVVAVQAPVTNLLTDGERLEVSYQADLKTYIDNRFNELAAAMVANC